MIPPARLTDDGRATGGPQHKVLGSLDQRSLPRFLAEAAPEHGSGRGHWWRRSSRPLPVKPSGQKAGARRGTGREPAAGVTVEATHQKDRVGRTHRAVHKGIPARTVANCSVRRAPSKDHKAATAE